jgi:MarR family transcriptional regulator for hemolysin
MYDCVEPQMAADLAGGIAHSLMLVGRRWRARLNDRLKVIGQTDARLAALEEISGAPDGLVQCELARRLGVEEPTVVRLVDALEAQDCVERRTRSGDRRAKVVQSKPAADQALSRGQAIVTGLRRELFAGMDPRDLAACARVLDGLSRKLERAQTPARGVSRRLCAQTDPTAVKSAAGWIPERPWTRTEASLVGPAGLEPAKAAQQMFRR